MNEDRVPVVPLFVSQLTSEATLGLPERRFREWIRREGIPHRRLGALVLVEVEVARERLRAAPHEPEDDVDDLEVLCRRAGLRTA